MKISQDFNNTIYNLSAINETLTRFSKICAGKIEKKRKYFHVTLKPRIKNIDMNKIALEFSNYVLGLMKNKTLI